MSTFLKLLVVGGAVRLLFVLVGTFVDAMPMRLKYTDVDYSVFSDAGSPYERATYRYSPVFALMLLPDALLGSHSVGKLLFSAFDIALGATMARLGRSRGLGDDAQIVAVAWLANPIAIGICTRGSSDAIVAALVAIAIDLADSKLPIMAGAILGSAAHVKLYPIIHLPAFVVHFVSADSNGFCKACACAASAIAAFLTTSVAAYLAYNDYLDEALLYHIRRVDHRHNFSPFWFPIYLALHASVRRNLIGLAPFILHAVSQAVTVACLARRDVAVCVFAQTMLFVAANKVSTAQYIIWWLPFAHLAAAPVARYAPRRLLADALLWLFLLSMWLAVAYALEFLGRPFHVQLWLLSLAFFAANILLLVDILRTQSELSANNLHALAKKKLRFDRRCKDAAQLN